MKNTNQWHSEMTVINDTAIMIWKSPAGQFYLSNKEVQWTVCGDRSPLEIVKEDSHLYEGKLFPLKRLVEESLRTVKSSNGSDIALISLTSAIVYWYMQAPDNDIAQELVLACSQRKLEQQATHLFV